ncbi:hypothetical protein HDU83_002774, partial [Entophlyctis luteolus]
MIPAITNAAATNEPADIAIMGEIKLAEEAVVVEFVVAVVVVDPCDTIGRFKFVSNDVCDAVAIVVVVAAGRKTGITEDAVARLAQQVSVEVWQKEKIEKKLEKIVSGIKLNEGGPKRDRAWGAEGGALAKSNKVGTQRRAVVAQAIAIPGGAVEAVRAAGGGAEGGGDSRGVEFEVDEMIKGSDVGDLGSNRLWDICGEGSVVGTH